MKEQDHNKAWGFTLFVDDLRAEVGGKLSAMGLYQADMIFPANLSFPTNIAKLCLLIMYYEKKGAVSDEVTFRVTYGSEEKPIVEFPIPRKDLNGSLDIGSSADLSPDDKERILHARIPVVLSPFAIPEVGRLRVRAHYPDGSVLKLGSMAIRTVSVEDFSKVMAASPMPSPG